MTGTSKLHHCTTGFDYDIDLAFVVDTSRSVGRYNFQLLTKFIAMIVRRLPVNKGQARVAMLTFSNYPQVCAYWSESALCKCVMFQWSAETSKRVFSMAFEVPRNLQVRFRLDDYKNSDALVHRILTLTNRGSGESNDVMAMESVRNDIFQEQRGDRPGAINTIIYITDGPYGTPSKAQLEAASLLDGSDIRIITLAIFLNEQINLQAQERMAGRPVSTFAPGSYYNFFYGIDSYVDPNFRGLLVYSVLPSDKLFLIGFDSLKEEMAFQVVEKLQEIRATLPPVTRIDEKPPITFNLHDFLSKNETSTARILTFTNAPRGTKQPDKASTKSKKDKKNKKDKKAKKDKKDKKNKKTSDKKSKVQETSETVKTSTATTTTATTTPVSTATRPPPTTSPRTSKKQDVLVPYQDFDEGYEGSGFFNSNNIGNSNKNNEFVKRQGKQRKNLFFS